MSELKEKTFSIQFLFLLLSLSIIIVDQKSYRYLDIIKIGINMKLMDVIFILFLSLIFIISICNEKINIIKIKKENFLVFFTLSIYLIINSFSVLRGYFNRGSWAFGVGRYSILEVYLFFFIFYSIKNEKQIKSLLIFFSIIIIPAWLLNFVIGYKGINNLLLGQESARFATSYTAFGIANISVLLLPFISKKKYLSKYFSAVPLRLILITSFVFVIIVQHRSVWMATFVGMVVLLTFLLIENREIISTIRYFVILLLIALFLYFLDIIISDGKFTTQVIVRKINFIVGGVETDVTGYWRLRGWLYVINRIIENNVFFGLGFSETGWYDSLTGNTIDVWEHNQYVHIFRASGILGITSLLLFLTTTIRFWLKTLKSVKAEIYFLVAMGAGSAFIMNIVYMFFYNQVSFIWINLGLIYIAKKLDDIKSISVPIKTRKLTLKN